MTEETTKHITSYVILGSNDDKQTWRVLGEGHGQGQNAALRKYLDENEVPTSNGDTWTFTAVPERSWQPVTPRAKTVTRYSLEPADGGTVSPVVPTVPDPVT